MAGAALDTTPVDSKTHKGHGESAGGGGGGGNGNPTGGGAPWPGVRYG